MVPLEQEAEHVLQADHSFQCPSTRGRQRSRYHKGVTGSARTRQTLKPQASQHTDATNISHDLLQLSLREAEGPSSMTPLSSKLKSISALFSAIDLAEKTNATLKTLIMGIFNKDNRLLNQKED